MTEVPQEILDFGAKMAKRGKWDWDPATATISAPNVRVVLSAHPDSRYAWADMHALNNDGEVVETTKHAFGMTMHNVFGRTYGFKNAFVATQSRSAELDYKMARLDELIALANEHGLEVTTTASGDKPHIYVAVGLGGLLTNRIYITHTDPLFWSIRNSLYGDAFIVREIGIVHAILIAASRLNSAKV